MGTPAAGAQLHLARLQVEAGDLGHQDANVAVTLEDRPQRIGDLAGRERSGRDLVGERLEEVEVPSIDERDLDRRPPQPERRLEAAEAAPDDDHAVRAGVTHRRSERSGGRFCLRVND